MERSETQKSGTWMGRNNVNERIRYKNRTERKLQDKIKNPSLLAHIPDRAKRLG